VVLVFHRIFPKLSNKLYSVVFPPQSTRFLKYQNYKLKNKCLDKESCFDKADFLIFYENGCFFYKKEEKQWFLITGFVSALGAERLSWIDEVVPLARVIKKARCNR